MKSFILICWLLLDMLTESVQAEEKMIRRHQDQQGLMAGGYDAAIQASVNFLAANMPADIVIAADQLQTNAEYALKARSSCAAASIVPDDIYYNYVLPFRLLDEPIDNWRVPFYVALLPSVQSSSTIQAAVQAVLPQVWTSLRSSASVAQLLGGLTPAELEKPIIFKGNNTPQIMAPISETLMKGYASCTGLSIVAAAALRSVGIPARIVGTAQWNTDEGGNHNWVEVWIGPSADDWIFFDAVPGLVSFNQVWFVPKPASLAQNGTITGIYATIWNTSIADSAYTVTWREPSTTLPAVDRSGFYTNVQP